MIDFPGGHSRLGAEDAQAFRWTGHLPPPWLFFHMDKTQADAKLKEVGVELNGVFLVRSYLSPMTFNYVISVVFKGKAVHNLCIMGPEGTYLVNGKRTPCKTVQQVVGHLRKKRSGWPVPLTTHIKNDEGPMLNPHAWDDTASASQALFGDTFNADAKMEAWNPFQTHPVAVTGATGKYASEINGVYQATDIVYGLGTFARHTIPGEIYNGLPALQKAGSPDRWLVFHAETHEWQFKSTADKDANQDVCFAKQSHTLFLEFQAFLTRSQEPEVAITVPTPLGMRFDGDAKKGYFVVSVKPDSNIAKTRKVSPGRYPLACV